MKVETDNEVDLRAINRVQYQPPKRKRFPWVLVGVVLIALVVLTAGILPRIQARTDLKKETLEMAVPVVSVVRTTGPSQINRLARQRQVTITSNVAPGVGQSTVAEALVKIVADMHMDPGYSAQPAGFTTAVAMRASPAAFA